MNNIKIAKTDFPILEVIKHRWSARSFSDKSIPTEEMNTLFEAARWAASANNEQPWQYYVAKKQTVGFETLFNTLWEGNQPWAKNAAALVVAIARKNFTADKTENHWATHDVGMANAHLLLQATALNIYCHPMAGFSKEKVVEALQLKPDQQPICIIALGYHGESNALDEPFKTRELTERKRNPVSEFVIGI
jgi:nitroreductase